MRRKLFKILVISALVIDTIFCYDSYGSHASGYGEGHDLKGIDAGGYGESGSDGYGSSGYGGGEGGEHSGGYGEGDNGGYGGGDGGGYEGGYGGGDGGGYEGGYGAEDSYAGKGPINAAILSSQSVSTIPIHSSGYGKPTRINVDAGIAPIIFKIKSRSSPIIPKASHIGTGGSFKKTFSRDKPHKMIHIVKKPVIHELKEIVTPYRRHIQKIKPVKQSIRTFVHQKNDGYY